MAVNVEIWSDVVCPWCYFGKRRFESALAQFPHRDAVNVVWRSFELDPNAPQQYPGTLDEMLAHTMGTTPERAAALNARVIGLAAGEGLDYHLDIARPGNTFDAHRLLHLAKARGLQAEAKERLMRGYFTEGMPVGDGEALVSALAEVGIDAEEACAVRRQTKQIPTRPGEVRDQRRQWRARLEGQILDLSQRQPSLAWQLRTEGE
jgi:predicted DsbA family dithiol-disulfide isomerase